MLLIFDREFRREKTLDVARRMGAKNETKKVKKETNGKTEKLEGQLLEITDEFFQEVAEDEEEREMIKQRGAQAQEQIQLAQDQATTYAGLVEGDTYQWEGTRSDSNGGSQPTAFAFTVEANGSVHF